MKKTIGEFEIIDHGIEHAQYFQGCGVSYTKFDEVVTGCGSNAKEAFDDALDSIAQNGTDVSEIENSGDAALYIGPEAERASVGNFLVSRGETEGEDCELYYYLSIRFNEKS